MTWLDAPDGVLAFARGGFACVVNLSHAPVPLPAGRGPARQRPGGWTAASCLRIPQPGCGSSAGEDLTQGGGEGVRLARLAVFAAQESAVVTGKGDGRDPEPSGHGRARPARQLLAGLGADADHDAGRCLAP